MTRPDDGVLVTQSTRIGQLSILAVAAGGGSSLDDSIREATADSALIVVVDCLDLAVLPTVTCAQLIAAHQQLTGQNRQLIVVNAPEQSLPYLRSQGVEVATTTDRAFAGDRALRTDEEAQALTVELAMAERARDEAFTLRDELEKLAETGAAPDSNALLSARDRAAAALDRFNAAVDRLQAAAYLEQTYRDDLTGALQRKAGLDQLRREVARANRAGTALVIAFVDVDRLKVVNDTSGHDSGDRLLAAVGEALRSGLRSYDVVMRYGGDEFVCALPQASLADAAHRLRDVQVRLAAAHRGASVSVGLAQLAAGESLERVLVRADQDLYRAKARAASHH
jgi:diguanylate cyclase (GGDEF)-like protein